MTLLRRFWPVVAVRARSQWPWAATLALPVVLTVVWFRFGNMVYFVDSFYPFSPLRNLFEFSASWASYNGLGTVNVTNFPLLPIVVFELVVRGLGAPAPLGQAVLFFAVLATGAAFMFLLVRDISFLAPRSAELAGVFAAGFYVLNPVFLELYWYLNFPGAAGVLAGLPAFAYFAERAARASAERRPIARPLLGIAVSSVVLSTSEVPYIGGAALVAGAILGWHLLRGGLSWPVLSRRASLVGTIVAVAFAANLFWIVPELLAIPYTTGVNAYGPSMDLGILTGNSAGASPLNVLTGRYFPISNGFAPWGSWYSQNAVLADLLPCIIVLVTFAPLLARRTGAGSIRYPGLLLVLAAVDLALVGLLMGSNPLSPASRTYLGLFYLNGTLQAFLRGPYLTFGAAYAFSSAALFGVGAATVVRWAARPMPRPTGRWAAVRPLVLRGRWRGVTVAVACAAVVLGYGWPFWTGAAVDQLTYPATPVVPPPLFAVSQYLSTHVGAGAAVVYPGTDGLTAGNWSRGYVGPSILEFSTGVPTYQYIYPPIGEVQGWELPMGFALPSLNSTLPVANLLRGLGAGYVVLDGSSGFYPITSWANLSNENWSLRHSPDIAPVAQIGPYSVFQVSDPVPRIYAPVNTERQTAALVPMESIARAYAMTAKNNTDLSQSGLFTSSATVSNITNSSFHVTAYWPSQAQRAKSGTGIHYPGWPEVVNAGALDIRTGETPLLFVNLTTQGNVTPIVAVAGTPVLQVFANDYPRTVQQFFSADTAEVATAASGSNWTFVFDLATTTGATRLRDGVLRHVLIELQPQGNYSGFLNATVQIALGAPTLLTPEFDPARSILVPDGLGGPGPDAIPGLVRPSLTFTETNAASYSVHATNATGRFIVVLTEGYDANWGFASASSEVHATHFEADGFANAWLVDSSRSTIGFNLSFALQVAVLPSAVISVASISLLFAASVSPQVRSVPRGLLVLLRRTRSRSRVGP
ncbi:MAG TPA: hypothetical protein VFF67_02075 [Thermoplasmata archaeon]|nr:hypothetical protein [Thermoplasmata archaeon]